MDSPASIRSPFSSFIFHPPSVNYHPLSTIKLHNVKILKTSAFSQLFVQSSLKSPVTQLQMAKAFPNNQPFSFLAPILKSVSGFAAKTSKTKSVSVLRGHIDSEALPRDYNGTVLQNGAFGMTIFSVTSTTRARINPFVATLASNPTFVSGLFALLVAQSMKVFFNFCVERKWDLRIMFASGGMPSSHSALCTALTTSVAICHGVADSLFPICLGFSLIVMYDAIGVRRHAGMQAEVLNLIVEDLFQGHPISQRKLKELLGHTPSQVFAGALLGIVVACFCCQGYFVAI